MTTPLAAPIALHAGYANGLSAQAIAGRVDMLHQNGHAWMPEDMQTTLASSPTSDSGMMQAAHTIKSTLASAWDGFTEAFDDPVLHKQPSTSLALARLVNSSLGPIPVEESDLTTIQADLQRIGFGKDLDVNGVWGAEWNDAYNEYAHHVVATQLAGGRPGSIPTGEAAHHWYEAFTPSHAFNTILGIAKSLPGDVRSLAADFASGVTNLTVDAKNLVTDPVGTLGDIHWGEQHDAAARAGAAVENIGRGNKLTPEQYERMANNPARLLQDLGTVLAIVPVVGQGAKAWEVASKTIGGEVSKEYAVRGPGVIAKSLFGGRSAAQIEADAARRGVLNSRVFTNIPLLKQAGPVIGKLADADGFYYRKRTLLATPYKYPAVRVAGDISQRIMVTGGLENLGAQISQGIAGPNQLTDDMLNTDATDLIDRSIQRITGTPFEHMFTDAVNALGFVLHGPLGSTANSTAAGDAVQHFVDATDEALGKVNLVGAYQRAKQAAENLRTLPSYDDMVADFGSEEHFKRFLVMKAAGLAAMGHAQKVAQDAGLQFGDSAYRDALADAHNAIWANPQEHLTAMRELIAHDGGNYLTNRLIQDMTRTSMDARDFVSDGKAWMQAGDLLTTSIRNGDARYLFGANGRTVIHDAQDDFDFGLGMGENPMRTSTVTRRKFNAEVSHLTGRVRSGIDAARRQAQQHITDAQAALADKKAAIAGMTSTDEGFQEARVAVRKAQGALQSAKLRQRKIEDALASNLGYRIEDTLAKLRGPRGSDSEWAHVAADVKRLRILIGPSLGRDEKFNLLEALEQGIDPDVLYTKINGAPRPSDAAIGSGQWMAENVPHDKGVLSVARIDTKTMQEARNELNALEIRLQQASDQDEVDRVVEQIKDFAHLEFGMDGRALGVFDDDPQRLIEVLHERSHDLASDVFLTPDASPRLRQAIEDMRALGYKPVIGSHIGHIWDGSLPPLEDVGGVVTRRKRVAGVLGIDPVQVSSRTVGQAARLRAQLKMQEAINTDKRIVLPPRHTAESVWKVLDDHNIFKPKMKLPERVAFYATYPIHKRGIEQLAGERGLSAGEAREAYEQELVRALQFRDVPRREAMKALTTPAEYENGAVWPGMDKRSAALIWRAGLEGYSARPNYLMGLSAIEDWGRAGFTILGKLAHAFPDSGAIQAFANAPNEIVQLRNRWRFSLSPFYDFRRVTKTNYKMIVDGTTPTYNPLKHLVDHGNFERAHELLRKLRGETSTAGYDDADRYLHQQSIYGVYNARHYEAYYAWEKHLEGWTDEQIHQGLLRVFEYGSTRKAGRSALERSVNTVFFPFSFEKTLIRNTGMYLLDHPQQALLITGAVDAYHRANRHEQISDWINDHLPILEDLNKMNAFAHGISPGQTGGINAPLANLFSPQVWQSKDYTVENLRGAVGIWHDFARLAEDVHQQAIIANNATRNAVSYAVHLGAPRSAFDPYLPMETQQAQRRDASDMRAKFIAALTSVLDANYGAASEDKIRWPDSPLLPPGVQGQPVDRTSIGYLVKRWYPAYDPTFSQQYAIRQQEEGKVALAKIAQTDPQRAQEIGVLQKLADSFAQKINSDAYDTPEAADITAKFRLLSTAAAEQDPDFYKYYNEHFAWLFGHLEEIQGVPSL